jgi:hypothetical protein
MYLKLNTDSSITYPYNLTEIYTDNPTISFPSTLTDELLEGFSIYRVIPTQRPALNWNEGVIQQTPTFDGQRWVQTWQVYTLTQSELDERIGQKWEQVRDYRNQLLTESDWTQIPDSPLYGNQEWLDYRQALRDVTNVENPFLIIWPNIPS